MDQSNPHRHVEYRNTRSIGHHYNETNKEADQNTDADTDYYGYASTALVP